MRTIVFRVASVAVLGLFVVCCDAMPSSIDEAAAQPAEAMVDSLYDQQEMLFQESVPAEPKSKTSQDVDAIMPEGTMVEVDSNNKMTAWMSKRLGVWSKDAAMLSQTDKHMHRMLEAEVNDEGSAYWARYLRHKNIDAPSPKGHSWTTNSGAVEGSLLETTSDDGSQICDPSVKQHHGYFKIQGSQNKNYFYWLFEAKENPKEAPLILWLTGGPGCSSELALFTENGPCKVMKDGKTTKKNPFSWNGKANLVFVDQPAGTGFSFGQRADMDKDENEVSNDLHHFMQELVKQYPQYHKSPFYIFGESYAGHFVPATGAKIMELNKAKDGEYIALKGIAVGNGLTDPAMQYPYYPQMAFKSPTTPPVMKDKKEAKQTYEAMVQAVPECVRQIKACNKGKKDDSVCSEAFGYCNQYLIDPVQSTGINVYDAREKCENPPLCGDYSHVQTFLQSSKVMKALGVKRRWSVCNFGVNGMFHADWMRSQEKHIPPMLANGQSVLIYAGDVDFICNWMGNKAWTLGMDWPKKKEFNAAPDREWTVNGEAVARERKVDKFSFVQIHKAGHMVPQDQPAVAMLMVNKFIAGQPMVPVVPAPATMTDTGVKN